MSASRVTEEMAGDDDRKHTSGGVLVAEDSNLGVLWVQKKGQLSPRPG